MTASRTPRAAAALPLFGLAVVEAVAMVVGVFTTSMSFAVARDSFMISNATIGLACAACGVVIARGRPDNLLGWLLLGAGVCQTATTAVTPWLYVALRDGWSDAAVRTLATAYSGAWPWSVSLFVPLAMLFFPDGRLPGRRWRAVVAVAVLNAPLQVLLFSSDPDPLSAVHPLPAAAHDRGASWLGVPDVASAGWLQVASALTLGATFVAVLASLVTRFRAGNDRVRRQLLWLLLAASVAAAVMVTSRLPGAYDDHGFPVILTALLGLIPVAMAIAVLRHQLLDIRLLWVRAVTYGVLTAGVVGVYLAAVEAVGRPLLQRTGWGASVLVTLLVATAFNPVRVRLQRRVGRLLYGERADAVQAASSMIAQLSSGAERPADVLPAICDALRLPYAALCGPDGPLGEHGRSSGPLESFELRHGGELLGELVVGVRSGQARLGGTDRAVLGLVAMPLGVALRADSLAAAVQQSRRHIVEAREEERRRIRRDLHDGLGPVLTGVAFRADALASLADRPERVRALGADIRTDVTGAIAEVRRLIYQLRPAALDEAGLVEAVRRHAERLDRRADGTPLRVEVHANPALPCLPAAVELAAYRIATEALTNVARHSDASRADVTLDADPNDLVLTVVDDGSPTPGVHAWVPGVGLDSMRDRAAELDGTLVASPTSSGGRVEVRLPRGA